MSAVELGFMPAIRGNVLGGALVGGMWRYQAGPGRGLLILLAKMSQDPVDDVPILNVADPEGIPPNPVESSFEPH